MSISGKQKSGINIFVKNISDRKSSLADKEQNDEFLKYDEAEQENAEPEFSKYIKRQQNHNNHNIDNTKDEISSEEDLNNYKKDFNDTFANNENYSGDFSNLTGSLNEKTSKIPFMVAFIFSLSWLFVVITMLADENTIKDWQQILTLNIVGDTEGAFFSLFSTLVFPIGFFWAIASLFYSAKENKNAVKTIVNASLFISQPQKQAGKAINTIVSIVKNDVSEINQTIEKAFKKTVHIQEIIDTQIQTINHSCFQQKNMLDNIITDMTKQKDALIASMEELQIKSANAFKPMANENVRIRNVVRESLEHVDSATLGLKQNLEKFNDITGKIVSVSKENCANIENTVENLYNVFDTGSNRVENTVEMFEIQNQKLENFSNALRNTAQDVENIVEQKQQNVERILNIISQKGEDIVNDVENGAKRFLMHVENAQDKINLIKDYLQNKGSDDTKQTIREFEQIIDKISSESEISIQKIKQGYSQAVNDIQQQSKNAALSLNKDIKDMNSMAQLTAQDIAITKDKIDIAIKQIPRTAEKTNAEIQKFIEKQTENIKNIGDRLYDNIKEEKLASNTNSLFQSTKNIRYERENLNNEPIRTNTKYKSERDSRNQTEQAEQTEQRANRQSKWGLNQLLSNARKAEENQQKIYDKTTAPLPDFSWNANDLVRAFNNVDLSNIWKRYHQGEHNVFNKSIYNMHGVSLFNEIKSRYEYDNNFRNDINQYLDEFEGLLSTETHEGKKEHILRTYLTSETGKIYVLLAHAAGRFQ